MKFQAKSTNGLVIGLFMVPLMLMSTVSTSHVSTNQNKITETLQITQQQASWIQNSETLSMMVFMPIAGKLGERFGTAKILFVSTMIASIFNLLFAIPFLSSNYFCVIILRVLAAVGLGLQLPNILPLVLQLAKPGHLRYYITMQTICVPLGAIVSSVLSGFVAKHIGWQWMCMIVMALGFTGAILLAVFTVLKYETNRKVKINFISSTVLSGGIASLVAGLIMVADSKIKLYVSIPLICVGLGALVFFYYFDQKVAADPLFAKKLMTSQQVKILGILLVSGGINAGEHFIQPYNYGRNYKVGAEKIGILMALAGASALLFSPIMTLLQRKFAARILLSFTFMFLVICQALNCAFQFVVNAVWFTALFNILQTGLFIASLLVLQSFNFTQCPQEHANQLGVLNQLFQRVGDVIGVTAAVMVNQIMGIAMDSNATFPKEAIVGSIMIFSAFSLVCVIVSTTIQPIKEEIGLKGGPDLTYGSKSDHVLDENLLQADIIKNPSELLAQAEGTYV